MRKGKGKRKKKEKRKKKFRTDSYVRNVVMKVKPHNHQLSAVTEIAPEFSRFLYTKAAE